MAFGIVLVVAGCGAIPPASPTPPRATPASTQAQTPVLPTSSPDALAALRRPIADLGQRLAATITVGGEPEWIGAGAGSVWVTNRRLNAVQRIDPTKDQVVASIPVNEPCNGFAFGDGAVWTASCADQTLVRIDPRKNEVEAAIHTPIAKDGEGQLAAEFGSIWISGGEGTLKRLDPSTDTFVASVVVPAGADAVSSSSADIWVTDPDGNDVLMISPAKNEVEGSVAVGPHPQFIAADPTSLWVLNQDDGTVSRIDLASRRALSIAAESAGRDAGCIAAGLAAAWITVPELPLTRVDAGTNGVTEQWSGPGGDCLTVGFGSVWLVNNALGTVSRIAPP